MLYVKWKSFERDDEMKNLGNCNCSLNLKN